MKQLLKAIAMRTPLYPVYRHFADRRNVRRQARQFQEWSGEDQKRLDFYRPFVASGEIVFDVGANWGNRAKVFARLGAVVVAVEPQTMCANFLRSIFRDTPNFHLDQKALGAATGQAELLISNYRTLSSLSPDWVQAVKKSGRFAPCEWNRKETVLVDTLDHLIAHYGRPAFVKIDVEGFEDQVMAGLSTPVRALSLEFTPEFMDSTLHSIEHLCRLGDYQFQISLAESMEFLLPQWSAADEVRRALAKVPPSSVGDLYARC